MTLATKNGSIIVKDGKLAENCECCGGWYCCFSSDCASDSIKSAAVTISAADYLQWTRQVAFRSTGNLYINTSFGFLGSAYSGTFALEKQTNSPTWTKVFTPSPHSTCVADLTLTVGRNSWSLVFRYSYLAYRSFTATPEYKELSQMVCQGVPDFTSGAYPDSSGPQISQVQSGSVEQCASLLYTNPPLSFRAVVPPQRPSIEFSSFDVVREEGNANAMATMGLSVTQ
jgi:hypothetical protein